MRTLFLFIFSCLVLLSYGLNTQASDKKISKLLIDSIVVGNKTTDSSASILISSLQIQQIIISRSNSLDNTILLSGSSQLMLGRKNYLLFNVVKGSDTLNIAVELILEGTNLIFQSKKGLAIHSCRKYGSCNSCLYIRNKQDKIIGCSCSNFVNDLDWECRHNLEKISN